MRYPESGMPLAQLTEQLMRGPSPLSVAERELIAAYTSGLNACQLCYNGHTAAAEALGVESGLLERLLEDLDGADCDVKLKALLHYVRKLNEEPARLTQSDLRAVMDAGWGEAAVYSAVSVCGLFNYMNRLSDAFGLRLSPESRERVGAMLAEHGYEMHDDHG